MSCETRYTELQGLKRHSSYKSIGNIREESRAVAYNTVKDEIERLTNLATTYARKGNSNLSLLNYKAANYYLYIIEYALIMRNTYEVLKETRSSCYETELSDYYDLTCIENSLLCLSGKYGTPYKINFYKIVSNLDFGLDASNCGECCVGIGDMIVEGIDDCTAFIIGDCEEAGSYEFSGGEFSPCEFQTDEITQAIGDDLYINCDI